jgi:hypothetical protein
MELSQVTNSGEKRQVNSAMKTCKYVNAVIAYYNNNNKVEKTKELVGE